MQKFYLVILFKFDKNLIIYIYYTILLLDLTVCLKTKCNKFFIFDTEKEEK